MTVYADLFGTASCSRTSSAATSRRSTRARLLGVLWSLLNPLVLLGVYLLVFGVIFPSPKTPRYAALPAGRSRVLDLLRDVDAIGGALADRLGRAVKKVRFPRQLVAFSMVATQAVTFAVMTVILVVLSLVFVPDARETVWLAIPLTVLFAAEVAGLALLSRA